MSKILEFKKEKNDHNSMIDQAYKAMNKGEFKRSDRDKFGLSLGSRWHDHGEPMGFLTGYSGFYGNSGCTYQCSPRLASYLQTVINKNMEKLVEEAIVLSQIDVEKKRLAAEEEAKSVLKEVDAT